MKKLILLVAAAALVLTGCASASTDGDLAPRTTVLPNGKTLVCVVLANETAGPAALTCDWDALR